MVVISFVLSEDVATLSIDAMAHLALLFVKPPSLVVLTVSRVSALIRLVDIIDWTHCIVVGRTFAHVLQSQCRWAATIVFLYTRSLHLRLPKLEIRLVLSSFL